MTIYSASSTAPVNIATLKYWGKRDKKLNLPTNNSISVTLSQKDLRTLTSVACSAEFTKDTLWLNGTPHSIDNERTISCLNDLRSLRRELEDNDPSQVKISNWKLHIVSENNFPTAAGLASSAAGFAALVASIASLYKLPQSPSELSKIARKGSGSACRSLMGGYVAWEMGTKEDGSDSRAVQVAPLEHWPTMKAAICVVSDDKKDVPSTSGMQLTVQTSDLFQYRIDSVAPKRYVEMCQAIQDKDFAKFGELTMKDSNSFHAVCLDSYPPIFYLNDTSKSLIKLVNVLNEKAGKIIAAYTFDAGPNAVIYYEQESESHVLGMLYAVLKSCSGMEKVSEKKITGVEHFSSFGDEIARGVSRVIFTEVGQGPTLVSDCLIDLETGEPKK